MTYTRTIIAQKVEGRQGALDPMALVQAEAEATKAEIVSRMPRRSGNMASKWTVNVLGDGMIEIVHEYSDPSHPLHVVLASLEGGARPHMIYPKDAAMLSWYDPELAAKVGQKGPYVHFRKVHHPGNQPYEMVRLSAENSEARLAALAPELALAVVEAK